MKRRLRKHPWNLIRLTPAKGARFPPRSATPRRKEHQMALRVYDTSGPEGHDVREGLPALRREWILGRGDVMSVPRAYIPDSKRRAELPKSLFRSVLRGT